MSRRLKRGNSRHGAQTLCDRIAEWRKLLANCGRKPTRKRVHALRVITLRIQAEAEHEAGELPHASHEAQAVIRFGKRAARLREALGSVRELDVWIAKLEGLRGSFTETPGYVPRSTRDTLLEIEEFKERLSGKRRSAAKKLMAEIEARQDGLLSAAKDLEEAAGERARKMDGQEAISIQEQLTSILSVFPAFDENNLHDFRKRIKEVRYLAEVHNGDPECARIAGQLKMVQAAIGEWHDWQVLAKTAKTGKHASGAEARELLNALTAETLEHAVAACSKVMDQILRWRATEAHSHGTVRRKPVVSDGADVPPIKMRA